MKNILLESHNIKNLFFGFGQFNYHLIKGLYNAQIDDLQLHLLVKDHSKLEKEFGSYYKYKKYYSFYRQPAFRIKKKYDLWHSLNQNTKIEPFFKQPYLLTVHDVNFVEEDSIDANHPTHLRFKAKLERANAITYISNYAKASTHKHFKVPNVPEYVIYNGNPVSQITIPNNYEPSIKPKAPYLFSIGEFTPRKNFLSLIKMLQFLPDLHLVLAGNNTTSHTQEIVSSLKSLGLENRVIIAGKISDTDKQYYLQHCTAFVFPSLREGFGIPIIEAMTFGKPVFASNNTSIPEVGGEHCFYWDHYDAEYMAQVVTNGLTKFQNQSQFYQDWYVQRAASFNWDKAALQYLDVYRSLL